MSDALAVESWQTFRAGSKSFSLASRFFSPAMLESTAKLYYWCRYCDDFIDEGQGSVEELVRQTHATFSGPEIELAAPFQALGDVTRQHGIPSYYAFELLEGMRMDVEHQGYATFEELELYCYRVASTVGLMMCHVMGLHQSAALKEAAHLGMAMQLTNIARDVAEDFNRGRVYLPRELLNKYYLTPHELCAPAKRSQLLQAVSELIHLSERYYQTGMRGVKYLPWRPALAVSVALFFYRGIGREILRRGEPALTERTVLSYWQKFFLTLSGLAFFLRQLPYRLRSTAGPVPIESIWRLQNE
jgi:15-cis-phytoene synthase